jgi:glycosyltransferase involved in cell wall biosynthesis
MRQSKDSSMPGSDDPLKILHVLRAPVGGLFRHVVDLARGQIARGHRVGIIADASTGGARAEAVFAAVARDLALGLTRVPMSRHIGTSDVTAAQHVARRLADTAADVVHGHGAKGGAYARLVRGRAIRAYTPHGGSLHYGRTSPLGFLYLTLERALMARTELFLFESAFGRDAFTAKVGQARGFVRVVHNGVTAAEFAAVTARADAADLVFVGELRSLKGVDVLLDALALLSRDGRTVSAIIVGDGPDATAFRAQAERLRLAHAVRFLAPMPAREAFALGRCLVVPSRAESLPYIVLEAAAAGIPLIATKVGGIPEIFGAQAGRLVPPDDPAALARAIAAVTQDHERALNEALTLRARVEAHFSADVMTEQVIAAYREARTASVSLPSH